MFERGLKDPIHYSNEKEKANDNANYDSHLPSISEKRIFIHKPSDFIKNKYTYFGNVSNNRDLLSMDSRKTYYSHKFNMKDFKKQMKQGNLILESIIKDETKIIPNLLKSYEINLNNNRDITKNYERVNESLHINSTKNLSNNLYKGNNNNAKTYNNNMFHYNENLNMINQKSERLVNLNFLISSPKKIKNNISSKNHYHHIYPNNGSRSLRTNYISKNSYQRANHYSIDASPRVNHPNIYHY